MSDEITGYLAIVLICAGCVVLAIRDTKPAVLALTEPPALHRLIDAALRWVGR